MSSEADQPQPAVESQELVSREPEHPVTAVAESRASAPAPVRSAKPRAGVPVWRTGKPDAFLAAAVDTARTAIEGITAAKDIGRHLAAKSEGDRLVTHLFESRLPGYGGWQWFAVLTRNSRSKVVTVNELGLLPSEDSILAPEWVPWAERVRPEDEQEPEQETAEVEPGVQEPASAEPAAAEDAAAEPAAGEQEQGPQPLQDQDSLQDQDQDQESGDGEPDDDGGQRGDEARTS
ncbi:FtsZ-interacting cell division protein ZipA [Pseudarthrobacter sp. W1I19]|uniref:DUF3027 domain-containing protein n=1 Tax=Pseudarthrobacter sp. W1I19 TaxID=3042288 RepID=UPI0027819C1F|nr:DUF3027 domain-containing protein [Pseudarthrobacter sp. W1I19]MDQ0924808.1 FtsZ-interacting cell division protein ZipA [Pseudarthrobacter sp. W1I19]